MKIQYQDTNLVVFESALFRTTTSLIIGNDHIVIVDPNWFPIELNFIWNFIQALDITVEKYLLFTHSDYDHIIGYHRFQSFKTIASEDFITNKNQQSILDQINTLDDDNYVNRNYKVVYPNIDLPISQDGQSIQLGSDQYFFYQARGHNSDGLITFDKTRGILIVGDYLSNIEFPYIYDSFQMYKDTLIKLEKIIIEESDLLLVPGHGDITTDKQEMIHRIKTSRNYIEALELSVKENSSFDLEGLLRAYDFPQVMTKFHNKNLALLKKELKLKES